MKRVFIAIEMSIDLSHRLVRFQESFEKQIDTDSDVSIRLTRPENIHATLQFIGDVSEELLFVISEKLKELSTSLFPFQVSAKGIGAFPSNDEAKVLWAGFDAQSTDLLELIRRAIEKELDSIGLEKEKRPFVPHITLGRFRAMKPVNIDELSKDLSGHLFGTTMIRDIILFESRSDDQGFRYKVLDRFRLGKAT